MAGQSQLKKYGPYGNQCPTNFSYQLGAHETIKEVIIRSGYIVDGIGFVVADACGKTSTKYYGGQGGDLHKIKLQPCEYITHISGTHGDYAHSCQREIATIKIHTNLKPCGYGAYGKGLDVKNVCSFNSPVECGERVVGIFGRANKYLDSVGVYANKCGC